MNVESVVCLWIGSTLLFTFALCRAASGPMPRPEFLAEAQPSGDFGNQPQANPPTL